MNGRIERILELAEITGRKNNPGVRALLRRLMLRPDQRLEEMLLRRLTAAAGDEAFDPQPFKSISPEEMEVPGTEGVPYVEWGRTVRFHCSEVVTGPEFRFPFMCRHGLVAGSTRSGKSSAVARMMTRLPAGAKCWIFDPENDPVYQNLALSFPVEDFYVLDLKDFKRNILEPPPNTAPEVWFNHVKRNLRESCFLRDGSMALLSALFDHCRKEQPGKQLALRHLRDKLIELRYRLLQGGREYSFYEATKNRLDGLLVNPLFDCAKGFDLAHLASKNVLFLCGSVGSEEYPLFVNDVLSWLSCYFEPSLNPVPLLVVVLEEVHRLTNAQRLRRADIAEPIVLDAVRTLAKRRVSLLIVDQVPSELPVQILANCSFRAIFSTIEGRDLYALERSLSLTWEQRSFISRLPQRVCVVQYSNQNFPEPFPVAIDQFQSRRDIDEELKARKANSLSRLSFVPLDSPAERSEQAAGSERAGQAAAPLVSKPALDYLIEISKDQFLPASRRDQDQGIPLSQGNALRKELARAGLICLEHVNTYGRARRILNTRITDKGYALLKSMRIPFERPRGKGSWEHAYHQRSIAAWGKLNGFEVSVERFHDGKSVDVCLEKDGERIAAEILCQGVHKELANLRDLQTGYSEVWFCVKDWDEARRLQELISLRFREEARAILTCVKFKLLGQFQDELAMRPHAGGAGQ